MLQSELSINQTNHARELRKQDTKLKRMLHILRENKGDPEYLADALHSMMEYANSHFKAEEDIMKKLDYPRYQIHKNQHKNFLEIIAKACLDITQKTNDPTQKIIELLEFWIDNHFANEDSQLDLFIYNARTLT